MSRNNQNTPPDTTTELTLEDEAVSTNRAATVIPLCVGETKTTIRWASPIWGSYTGPNPYSTGGGKKG